METIQERKKKATEIQVSETPPFPREIFLDITSFCNHACVFCANKLTSNKKTLSPDFVKRVLKEAYDCGARDLALYATGESFLIKELAGYISYAKKNGYEYLFITTNGSLCTPENVKPVIDAGLDSIKFSISAGTRDTYREIHGRDDFDKVIENLKWISSYRKETGKQFRIYVTMVYTDRTQFEVEILKNIVMEYIDEWDPHPLNNQCGNMYENNQLGFIDPNNPRARGKREICFQPFKSFTITSAGRLSACVLDYSNDLIIADLNNTSLKEVWTSDLYKSFRRKHINKDLDGLICYNCINNKNEPVIPLTPEYAVHFKEN